MKPAGCPTRRDYETGVSGAGRDLRWGTGPTNMPGNEVNLWKKL